jgi:hypothetical protein
MKAEIKALPLAKRVELLTRTFVEKTEEVFGEDDASLLHFYDRNAWHIQHPRSGEQAALTIDVEETGWFGVLNGYESPEAEERANAFLDRVTGALGFDWDMGAEEICEYGFLHFWPTEKRSL